jgi:hypothetical protein
MKCQSSSYAIAAAAAAVRPYSDRPGWPPPPAASRIAACEIPGLTTCRGHSRRRRQGTPISVVRRMSRQGVSKRQSTAK